MKLHGRGCRDDIMWLCIVTCHLWHASQYAICLHTFYSIIPTSLTFYLTCTILTL